jgi:16S rRNA (adenine1518-N6/adenine1519-N6)-dimethyltransferase
LKKSYEKARFRREDGHAFKHDLGQHFLRDEELLISLVASTGVTVDSGVLEIGPGDGALTACLCRAARQVVAVEADESLLPYLRVKLEPYANVALVHGDIRRQNLSALCAPLGRDFFVIANIPYSITTLLLDLLWESKLPIRQISVMIQKEVADKLLATPADEAYGLLSVKCQYYCIPSLERIVLAEAFTPPPKVDSAFVHLAMRREPPAPVTDEALLFHLMKSGFAMRRKTLVNALKGAVSLTGDDLREILSAQGLPPTVRGEALTVDQWIAFANACHDRRSRTP